MTDREIMQQALEALESPSGGHDLNSLSLAVAEVALALRERLAQPEQKPMHPEIRKMWENHFDKCFQYFSAQGPCETTGKQSLQVEPVALPLYTTAPQESVTMCASTTCDKRTECSRNAASGTAPNFYRQSYFVSTEMTEDGCPYYSPVHTKKYVTEERNAN